MTGPLNTNTLRWINKSTENRRVKTFLLFCFLCFYSQSLNAQINKDSVRVAEMINQSHDRLLAHQYKEASSIAHESLNQSSKMDLKWGILGSLLIIAQAEKSLANFPTSLNHYLQALSEIEKQRDTKMLGWVNMKIGELFQDWGVPEKALPYYHASLKLQGIQSKYTSTLIERIAEVHMKLNQRPMALENYFKLLDIARSSSDPLQTKNILEKIAFIYSLSGDTENSLKYNLQILEIDKELKNPINTAATLNVIGNHYKDLKNYDKALEYYEAALAKNRQVNAKGSSDNSIVTNLINIGTIYQSKGDNRNSLKYFNEALHIKEKTGTSVEVAVMHNYLASLYLTQQNYSEAERHTKLAISLLSGTDNGRILVTSYKRLSEIYGKQGSYEKSLVSYQAYSMLKDSLLYRDQLAQEKEKFKEYIIQTTEKEAKLSLIDQEMQALELRNEKEIAEREKQAITLLLKEKELQNLSLQKEQLEQARAVQHLQLKQSIVEKEKQEQALLLLEQKRDAEILKNELKEKEREKEIAFKNTKLALQQSQLDQAAIQRKNLIYTSVLFLALILLTLFAYIIKQRDNKILQAQYNEINRQKEEIEQINKTLVELNNEKNDLIGIVAHDLKSPLNQISGMLELVKLTSKDRSPEQVEYTTKIEQSTNRLKKMVSKILDVSAIESKTLNITIEEINFVSFLDEIVNRFTTQAYNKNIAIVKEFTEVGTIMSDAGYLSEVLENLMSNAVKYSPLGKQILVRLTQRVSVVRIEFIDQGQGISAKDIKNLFGKYHKLTARPTAGEDSTGLGLSIVKKYVQTLKGNVWCESEEGKGSNFIVELPLS